MPVHRGIDKKGSYYQYGHAKKYYYERGNEKSRKIARIKAVNQGKAIKASEARARIYIVN